MSKTKIPTELSHIISELLEKEEDDFSAPNFNSVDYINKNFKTEEDLKINLDKYVNNARSLIINKKDEVLKSVREQTNSGSRGRQNLEESKRTIQDLFLKIGEIKTKAENSEHMVTEICRDIKSLDFAKSNLTVTIRSLERVSSLSNYIEKLENFISKNQYDAIGNILAGTTEFIEHFRDYLDIPRIKDLNQRYEKCKETLDSRIRDDFKAYMKNDSNVTVQTLKDQCQILDNYPKNELTEFFVWFKEQKLAQYSKFFAPKEPQSGLQDTDKRIMWLKTTLQNYDTLFRPIFPPHWKMDKELAFEFAVRTQFHFSEILNATRNSISAEVLISALKRVLDFEREMTYKFGTEKAVSTDSSEVKEKSIFQGVISSVFDVHMDVYLNQLERDLEAHHNQLMEKENWDAEEDQGVTVFTSSTRLVEYWTELVQGLSKFSRGEPMFKFFGILNKSLLKYVGELQKIIPITNNLSEKDQKRVCLNINTSEYFLNNTIPGMIGTFKELLDSKYEEELQLEKARNEFGGIIARSSKALVTGLMTQCEVELNNMLKLPWSNWDHAGDTSSFVNHIGDIVNNYASFAKTWLTTAQHYRYFVDSFVLTFCNTLTEYLYKFRRISDPGGQQLTFDLNALESNLQNIPEINQGIQKRIKKEMKKIHSQRLKFILLPQNPDPQQVVDETLNFYTSIVSDHAVDDLEKLLEVKGVGRIEAKNILDAYRKKYGANRFRNVKEATPNVSSILTMTSDLVDNTASSFSNVRNLFTFSFRDPKKDQ